MQELPTNAPNRENNWNRGPLFFHVPDEIHILLDEPHPDPNNPDYRPDPVQMWNRHDALWQALNDRLSENAADSRYFGSVAIQERIEVRANRLRKPNGGTN